MAYTNFQNCTKQQYDDIIYGQSDVNRCKLYFDNIELEDADNYLEKITFTNRVLPENGKKVFSLDNFISQEVEIVIHNIEITSLDDKVRIELGTIVGSNSLGDIYEDIPMGVYNIQDTPTRSDDKITIKLRDNAVLFDFKYNAKPLIDNLGGSATKMQILQDICNQANVVCNVNSFLGDSDAIGIYDNTITGRMYVAYLAEQAGCIAKVDRTGALIFIPLNNLTTQRIPLSVVSKYTKGTTYEIQRVVYELGTIKFETSNDETLQTFYISSLNPYISNQEQVQTIFNNILDGFEIDSAEILSNIIGNPSIDGYDLIQVYDDESENDVVVFTTLANNTLIYNGKFKSKYKTEIGLEERTENTTNTGEAVFQKTIKSEIDLLEGEVRTTVQEVKEYDTRITENENAINGTPTYQITIDETFQSDKPYYKLVNDEYILLVEGTDYNDGDTIASVGYNVYDVMYVDSMMDTVNSNIQNQINEAMQVIQSTLLEQTSEKFTMWFEQTGLANDLAKLQGKVDENGTNINDMRAFIEYGTMPQSSPYAGSPYILLGEANAETRLRILDNRIQFLLNAGTEDEKEVAYISDQKLNINESSIIKRQVIGDDSGKWITEVDSLGNLNTYWGG